MTTHEELRIPGIDNPYFFQHRLRSPEDHEFNLPNQEKVNELDKKFWKDKSYGLSCYVKLHGSFWWKSASGFPVMVIGAEKTNLIQSEPYLLWSHGIFREVLARPACNLVVMGYGFGDKHINSIICESIDKLGLKLYVVSPEPPEDFRKKLESHPNDDPTARIWRALQGYYCCKVTELCNNGNLTPRGKSLFANVGL